MADFNQEFISDVHARLKEEFQTYFSVDIPFNVTLYSDTAEGKRITAISTAKLLLVVPIEAHYKTVAFFFDQPLDNSYKTLTQFLQHALGVLPSKMDRRFRVTQANGETRDYYTDQINYNNTIYIFCPSIELPKEEIIDFFVSEGKQVYIRDLSYYTQRWSVRRPDVFISHDSTDKATVAEPLYHALVARGLKVWLDKYTLKLGDSLTQKINEGITECRYGILILSKSFLANERWAKRELNSFSIKEIIEGSNRLIPVWHGIGEEDLKNTDNYWLIDKLGGNTSDGIEALANRIVADIGAPIVAPKIQPKQIKTSEPNTASKEQVPPQIHVKKTLIQELILNTWKDPVWSKIIAAIIIALAGSIWAVIYQHENTPSTQDITALTISESKQDAKEIAALDTEIGGRLRYFKSNINNVNTCGDYVEIVGAIVFYQNFPQPIYTVDPAYKEQTFRTLLTRLSLKVSNDNSRKDEVKRALDGLDQIQHDARRPMSDCPTRGSMQEPVTFEQSTSLHLIQTLLAIYFNSKHWE